MASKRKVNLSDYDMTTTLGTGSFGRVLLCKNKKSGEFYAMKRLKKADIIKLRQVDHVISENTILADIDHPFLVRIRTSPRWHTRLPSLPPHRPCLSRLASRASPRTLDTCTS